MGIDRIHWSKIPTPAGSEIALSIVQVLRKMPKPRDFGTGSIDQFKGGGEGENWLSYEYYICSKTMFENSIFYKVFLKSLNDNISVESTSYKRIIYEYVQLSQFKSNPTVILFEKKGAHKI